MLKTYLVFLFIFLAPYLTTNAQVVFEGSIKDENNKPLELANILAIPKDSISKIAFTTSKVDGNFKLELKAHTSYKLTVSYLGYVTINEEIETVETSILKNYILKDDINELEEIKLDYQPAISIKKDTTTYKVSVFTNGKERKLREILKKLPGIEVDREGNVIANGKKVTQVLVENKQFFNGRSKLAVNNIPADVIHDIQIIEDYHETSFMKGLDNSEEIAMNINLKEDKKEFVFGDIEAGLGLKKLYKVHPKIFKYNPKTTFNFIGDLNNTSEKSFTLSDYIGFEGSINQENRASIFNSNIASFLRNNDYTKNSHKFAALNTQFNPNTKNEWRAFIIAFDDKNNFENNTEFTYLNDDISELRTSKNKNKSNVLLGKLYYKYTPDIRTVIKVEARAEHNNLNNNDANTSVISTNSNDYSIDKDAETTAISLNLKAEKQFSKGHTTSLFSNFDYNDKQEFKKWSSLTNLYNNSIPILDDSFYSIRQNELQNYKVINIFLKHYWVLNRKNHLYFNVSTEQHRANYKTKDYQELSNGNVNNFNGFNTNLVNNYNKTQMNVEFKHIIWDIIAQFKLGVEFHNWNNMQLGETQSSTKKTLIPKVKLSYSFDDKNNLEFEYSKSSNFPNYKMFADGSIIRSFNSISLGNPFLEINFANTYTLFFNHTNIYSWSFYSYLGYTERKKTISNNIMFNGIFSETTPINITTPYKSIFTSIKALYNRPYWKFSSTIRYNNFNIPTLINDEELQTNLKQISFNINFTTKFEENPNIEINANSSFSNNYDSTFKNNQNTTYLETHFWYDYKNWKFNVDFSQTYFKNQLFSTTSSSYNNFNTSIFYNKENSPLGIEVKITNLTNNKSKITSTFSSSLFTEDITYIFTRTIMLLLSYKL
ncbi:MAG: carboxypeptidase-like regulatory domain-containing protein [Flavobacteriaceae bacterium]